MNSLAESMNRMHQTHRQKGFALFVVLILLLVTTLLALSSMRGTLLEERMSGSMYDRSIMFQAAESALREAEEVVSNKRSFDFTAACTDGLCGLPNPDNTDGFIERWMDPDFDSWVEGTAVTSGDLSVTPEYFVEYMGLSPNWIGCDQVEPVPVGCMGPRYRIVARAGVANRAEVLLQSAYTSPE